MSKNQYFLDRPFIDVFSIKKFIITRFAVSIFDEEWLKHRIKIFETITLPSFEQTDIGNNFYWVLLIDKDMPTESKTELELVVSNSVICSNIHVLEVDYFFEINEAIKDFINKNTYKNEMIIQARFDSDDAISSGFFLEFAKIMHIYKINSPTLITFSNIYEFWLDSDKQKINKLKEPFHSMNTFLITDNKEITSYQTDHYGMEKYAKSIGYKVLIINNKRSFFLWSRFVTQTSAVQDSLVEKKQQRKNLILKLFKSETNIKIKFIEIYEKLKRLFLIKFPNKFNRSKSLPLSILTIEFGVNIHKLNDYYYMYPHPPDIGFKLCNNSQIEDQAKRIKAELIYFKDKEILSIAEVDKKNSLQQKLKALKKVFIKERLASRIIMK